MIGVTDPRLAHQNHGWRCKLADQDIKSRFSESLMAYLELQYGDINDLPPCKSPIEKMMHWALSVAALFGDSCYVVINEQHKISSYTVDFHVKLCYYGEDCKCDAEVIVECDGHEFHERTKEQASRDKERDRTLQQLGYNVFRYSGSDIWKDAMVCASEVIEFLQCKIEEYRVNLALGK
jgi:very-short-patch-repair endonuclease